ncbi:MAG TPA: IclR family transcriptional regulator [Clostridiales bacterium]|nr:IclR family transcriptional regulator [Clostridiales bacterium]
MNSDKNIHRSTSRVLDILDLVAANPSKYTLTDICELTASPKSSLHPILYTLVSRHFLALDSNSRYRIDYSAYQVGNSYLTQLNFLDNVEKILRDLTNVSMETSHFAILVDGDVLYMKKIDSPESIRMTSHVGNRMPAYGTALGKALLIDCESPELKKLYPNGLPPITPSTITDLNVLLNQIHEARTNGFTYEIEESTQYIRCYAVPIRKNGRVVAAISVAIPTFRYTEEKASLVKLLLFDSKSKIEGILNSIDTDFSSLI